MAKHYYRFQNSAQKDVGTDVLALDILRARDHGLNPYTKYLELSTKKRIQSWFDLRSFIIREVKKKNYSTLHKAIVSHAHMRTAKENASIKMKLTKSKKLYGFQINE